MKIVPGETSLDTKGVVKATKGVVLQRTGGGGLFLVSTLVRNDTSVLKGERGTCTLSKQRP